ncbi:MAG: MarR family transcriptional regulator [Sulfitobacter sp.]|nr:MarR family transcriptional regulator [Sulfitobacter sp.]
MAKERTDAQRYQLSQQVGFNLRRANQRHVAIFAKHVEGLTPTQFAALARLYEFESLSQNKLGRLTAMDSATIKGVVERLRAKGLVSSRPDLNDQRLRLVELTEAGAATFERAEAQAQMARAETMEGLSAEEARLFEVLLGKLV